MNAKTFAPIVLSMTLGLAVVLGGCGNPVSDAPEASPTVATPEEAVPVSTAPDAVVEAFYTWYLDYIGDRASGEMRNPLVDGAYGSSEYLSEDFIQQIDELLASFDQGGYDPFLCAQDIPDTFGVEQTQVSDDQASVILHQIWNAGTEYESTQDVTVELRKVDGEWKIADVICLPESEQTGEVEPLVELAKADLAERLNVNPGEIEVESVEATEFPDASLGVPEPGKMYAQVVTPGYVIKLAAGGDVYEYHASGDRVVLVPAEGQPPKGSITIEGVQVTDGESIAVHGQSTLPDGTCLGTELWADGVLQTWWPGETCVPVQDGAWQLSVPLGRDGVPVELEDTAQYVVRAYQQDGPNIVAVFPFDLAGPPAPAGE
jgi:hypothetical protein